MPLWFKINVTHGEKYKIKLWEVLNRCLRLADVTARLSCQTPLFIFCRLLPVLFLLTLSPPINPPHITTVCCSLCLSSICTRYFSDFCQLLQASAFPSPPFQPPSLAFPCMCVCMCVRMMLKLNFPQFFLFHLKPFYPWLHSELPHSTGVCVVGLNALESSSWFWFDFLLVSLQPCFPHVKVSSTLVTKVSSDKTVCVGV